jgi:hypothetical protein
MFKIMTTKTYKDDLNESYELGFMQGIDVATLIASEHTEYTRRNTIVKSLRNHLIKLENGE